MGNLRAVVAAAIKTATRCQDDNTCVEHTEEAGGEKDGGEGPACQPT